MEYSQDIAERMRFLRQELGKSLKEVQEDTGITTSLYTLMEQGKRRVTDRTIKVLNFVYCVSEEWLREGKGEMLCPPPEKILWQPTEEGKKMLEIFEQLSPALRMSALTFFTNILASEKARRQVRRDKAQQKKEASRDENKETCDDE